MVSMKGGGVSERMVSVGEKVGMMCEWDGFPKKM